MSSEREKSIEEAVESGDPMALARVATTEELQRLKATEERVMGVLNYYYRSAMN